MSHQGGPAIYRAPNKKGTSDPRQKYGLYDQNGGGGAGGGGMTSRYMAAGPTGKTILLVAHWNQRWGSFIGKIHPELLLTLLDILSFGLNAVQECLCDDVL